MNTEEPNSRDEELLAEYRRASAAEAGTPSESTRRAILDAAKAEARRRQPAANDSRYLWSAVAGVAVLGIALMVLREADLGLSKPVTITTTVESDAATRALDTAARAESAATVSAPAAAPPTPSPPERAQQLARDEAKLSVAQEPRPAVSAEKSLGVGTLRTNSLAAGGETLRGQFPEAWASTSPPAMVWIIEDARGNTLSKGTLATGEPLPALRKAEFAQTAWSIRTTVNAAGIPVQVATARAVPR